MRPSVAVEPAPAEDLLVAFRLIFQHAAPDEREARAANALRLVHEGELDPAGVFIVRCAKELLGALVCLLVPGAGALVWPPQTAAFDRPEQVEDELVRHAIAWVRQRGAKLAQTLLAPQESYLAAPLLRNGFVHVTSLEYLWHALRVPADSLRPGRDLTYQTYKDGDKELFLRTLLRTYEETRDCPEINGVRNLDEILEGHRAQGVHDPDRWWLALADGRPAGVLLLTDIPEWHGWDVSYLGVVPEARRLGIGTELSRKALREARAAGARQLTLAVDARNLPACHLYRDLGFEPFDQREVYLAILPVTSDA